MTEALRPPRSVLPGLGIGHRQQHAGTVAGAVPKARARVEPRRPLHIAVVVGVSAGAYAASLAGVTALQAASERSLAADYAPAAAAIDQLRSQHDAMDTRLAGGATAYDRAAAAYDQVAGDLAAYEKQLGTLAKQVARAKGSASWMPTYGGSLPSVGRSSAPASRPTSHATTCASGKICP